MQEQSFRRMNAAGKKIPVVPGAWMAHLMHLWQSGVKPSIKLCLRTEDQMLDLARSQMQLHPVNSDSTQDFSDQAINKVNSDISDASQLLQVRLLVASYM
jgi:hypothetical protein